MTAVELFAGAGGATCGLLAAGLDLRLAVEWDAQAVAASRAAGHTMAVQADVREVTRTWSEDSPDLLWASPPCQAFSSAGKRLGEADERNGWPWVLDAIDAMKPTWTICENVPGLLHHTGDCPERQERVLFRAPPTPGCAGCYWRETVLPAFRKRFASVEVRTLDAADFGIPQHRKRVFLVAGPRAIQWPEPTHGPGRAHPWVSIGEALGVLVYLHATDPGTRRAGDVLQYPRGWGRAATEPGRWNDPAPTVSATEERGTNYRKNGDGPQGGPPRASDAAFLAGGIRRLTVEQCAILQGFPVGYPFQGTQGDRFRQVGNAVPPRMAELLARAVMAS